MKAAIWVGITVGGIVGGLVGTWIDGNGFGVWGIILSTIGSLAGVWAGYKFAKSYL